MRDAIVIENLKKSFGDKKAVQGISLRVPKGAMYGIIGPNGAGKSTTLRMMLSILMPDSGALSILGEQSALKAKDRIGYLPEERGVYRKMKVADFLLHMAVLKGVGRAQARQRVTDWLARIDLPEVAKKRCEELSKGMQQKVQFIASVIHEPELLILDEPFSGLDPVNMRLLKELILAEHARGVTVLFSTHVMSQAEQICDHIVMIHNGQKVLDDPLSEIYRRHAPRALRFEALDASVDVAAVLDTLPDIDARSVSGHQWLLTIKKEASIGQVAQHLAAQIAPARLEVIRPSLEDVFIEIATKADKSIVEVVA